MDNLAKKLGLRTDPTIFFWSAGIMVAFLLALLVAKEPIAVFFGAARTWIVTYLGWFFIFGVSTWVLFLLWVALGRFGSIRLGKEEDRPEYSNASWFAMLFAGGVGTVLMFWGVAEPIYHFSEPPYGGVEPFSVEAADDAMGFAIYHLGLHTWSIFTLPGLAFAYFIYRHGLPVRFSSAFYPLLKDKIYGPIGKTLDIFAIVGTLFGVAVSIGLGTNQIASGLQALWGIDDTVGIKVLIIVLLTAVAVASIVAGLDAGVKLLSNINILMAVGLLLFVLFAGSTIFLLRSVIETLGIYLSNIMPMAFWNDSLAQYTQTDGTWGWQGSWTVFYWAWTVTWSPFVGIFVARISRGRTVREFVLGVMFAPSIFTLVWFSVFGWSAIQMAGIGGDGSGGGIVDAVHANVATAMFVFLEGFPATQIVSGFVILIVAIFFATSSDSASLVIDMLCTGTEDPGPVHQRVFWGVSEGMLAAMLIVLAGQAGLDALQQVITVIGLPVFIMVFAMMFALLRAFSLETVGEVKVGPAPDLSKL